MLKSPCEMTMCIMTGLAACWLASSTEVAAQSTPPALVVVTDPRDAECVKRIGCDLVRVERLFEPGASAPPSDYAACNERIRELLGFQLYLSRADAYCPRECVWRERLVMTNPKGESHRLRPPRRGAAMDGYCRMQQAFEIHRVLTLALPEHRQSLDANLKAELHRLGSLRPYSPRLALSD